MQQTATKGLRQKTSKNKQQNYKTIIYTFTLLYEEVLSGTLVVMGTMTRNIAQTNRKGKKPSGKC